MHLKQLNHYLGLIDLNKTQLLQNLNLEHLDQHLYRLQLKKHLETPVLLENQLLYYLLVDLFVLLDTQLLHYYLVDLFVH